MPARTLLLLALAGLIVVPAPGGSARQPPAGEPLHRPLDRLLDLYVRDGFVYYNALKADHAALDRYVTALGEVTAGELSGWPRERQLAFWINAYNAIVLQAVARHYPIRGTAPQYPRNSIRQIPGVFERTPHRVAGRSLTLDAIEKSVFPGLRDPRAYLALGRGAAGSGRLRSEAYDGERLEEQLRQVTRETVSRPWLFRIDQLQRQRGPHHIVTIVVPEFIPARWWQQLLHNQTALLIKGQLLFHKNVVVTDVPYHLQH